MSGDGAERREAERAAIDLKVEYRRLNSFFADYTRNISRGGTFIRTQKPLPVGTEFNFLLLVPTLPEPLSLRGEVRWVVRPEDAAILADDGGEVAEPGMGIRFRYADAIERSRIEHVVEELMERSLGKQLSDKLTRRR